MRPAFNKTLVELAREDERIFLVLADIGFNAVEPFANEFPDRFFNVGVAEQDMTGIACGLALEGNIAFTYTIGNFVSIRCLEQVRNDVCYHNVNVKIIAIGGGVAYGALGSSHHCEQDLAIMRSLPNLIVLSPGDAVETRLLTRAIAAHNGPCYMRVGRGKELVVHKSDPDLEIGKAITMREGNDLTLISTGDMLPYVMDASESLEQNRINARVLSMHTIKPLDKEAIISAARQTGAIITIEEHNILGGLGGAVAEILVESDCHKVPFKRMGLNDAFCKKIGCQKYLRKEYGLSVEDIVNTATSVTGKKQ
ncbi:MAG: transketolase C-terminal domain-containing protein [bacterium]|nr:transketolase C-terminal domain-containing protein [bacterium]